MMTTFALPGNSAIARDSELLLGADYKAVRRTGCSLFATGTERSATKAAGDISQINVNSTLAEAINALPAFG
jgi:hypothetical protein